MWPRERQAILWRPTPLTWTGESSVNEIILTSFAAMVMRAFFLSAKAGQPCAPGHDAAPLCGWASALPSLRTPRQGPAPWNPLPCSQKCPGSRGRGLDLRPPFKSLLKSHLPMPALFHSILLGQGGAPQHLGMLDIMS